jgi:hypothetical protein
MQIDRDRSACPACGAAGLAFFPVLHHLICAYVGPQYDFVPIEAGYACPKCRRAIVSDDPACEIVGTSARCGHCGREMVVSPPGRAQAAAAPVAPERSVPRTRWRGRIDHAFADLGRRLRALRARMPR